MVRELGVAVGVEIDDSSIEWKRLAPEEA